MTTPSQVVLDLLRGAQKAADCRRRKVGAVCVDFRGRIVGVGWNGLLSGSCTEGACPRGQLSYDECTAFSSYSNCSAIHAEDSAFRAAGDRAYGSTLYVTCEPCPDCEVLCEEYEATVEVVAMP